MEAEDARHDVPYTKKIAVAKEPPTEPAMPPSKPPMGDDVWEKRVAEVVKDRRAKALELAVSCVENAANVYSLADDFLRYIETGERPA